MNMMHTIDPDMMASLARQTGSARPPDSSASPMVGSNSTAINA